MLNSAGKELLVKMRINKKPVKSARNIIEREGVKTSFTGLLALLPLIG